MYFLEQFTNPPTADSASLLKVFLILSLLIFLPFIALVLGGASMSVFYYSKGKKSGNKLYLRFSKDILDKIIITKNVSYGMGLIPLTAIIFIYAQLLYGEKIISVSLFIMSLILFAVGFAFIYKFKNNFYLENIYKLFKEKASGLDTAQTENFENIYIANNLKNGQIGLTLILTAAFFFIGGSVIASNKGLWDSVNNIFALTINGTIWLNYIHFLVSTISIAAVAILYMFFIWQGGIVKDDGEYSEFVRKTAGWTALFSTMAQPFFFFISFIFSAQSGLTSSVFVIAVIVLFVILYACNLIYAVIKNSDVKYSSLAFFLVFIVLLFNVIKDQAIFAGSSKVHMLLVNQKADEMIKERFSKTLDVAGINPEEIYNSKCSACHKFDIKLVGPPYKETVPKYNGDVKKLSEFIYNPQKINPDFPAMPNQGLKKKEADAMAQWLLQKVSGK